MFARFFVQDILTSKFVGDEISITLSFFFPSSTTVYVFFFNFMHKYTIVAKRDRTTKLRTDIHAIAGIEAIDVIKSKLQKEQKN